LVGGVRFAEAQSENFEGGDLGKISIVLGVRWKKCSHLDGGEGLRLRVAQESKLREDELCEEWGRDDHVVEVCI
jgi:hypothetical protein